jgi:N utilization substance protein A
VDPETQTALVIVPDYQLSLAIGREGQNARLAARLTGWRIDIKSETQFVDEQRGPRPVVAPVVSVPAAEVEPPDGEPAGSGGDSATPDDGSGASIDDGEPAATTDGAGETLVVHAVESAEEKAEA